MPLLKQSLFRTVCGFFPFSPRYRPLLCMIRSVPWDTFWIPPPHDRNDTKSIQQAVRRRRGNTWHRYPCSSSLSCAHSVPWTGPQCAIATYISQWYHPDQYQTCLRQNTRHSIPQFYGQISVSWMQGGRNHWSSFHFIHVEFMKDYLLLGLVHGWELFPRLWIPEHEYQVVHFPFV